LRLSLQPFVATAFIAHSLVIGVLLTSISWSDVLMAAEIKAETEPRAIETIEIKGVTLKKDGHSPKYARVSGSFGDDKALIDIARSVTAITEQMMQQYAINSLQDILTLTPNSYAASGFGAPSLPSLRGQLGELFENGMRRQVGNNGLGIPLSFNAIGQMDVVKGPPPVMLGSTQRNGGFVNLVSKKASLQQASRQLTVSAGQWQQYRAQFDINQPLIDDVAGVRLSVEHIDENSFYDFSHHRSTNVYLTGRWQINADTRWDLSAEYYQVDYTDIAGINRPTQALIDSGLYITGQGRQPNGSEVPGANAVISPTGQVVIPRNRVLTDPDDINFANTYLLHSEYRQQLNRRWLVRNLSYFQHLSRDEIAGNSFVEIIDGADTFENRLELQYQWQAKQQSTFGLNIRYNKVLGYSQFTTEADLPIDLTASLQNRRIPLTPEQQARLIQLRPGVFVSPGGQYDLNNNGVGDYLLSDTTDSSSWQTGLFVQHESQWSDDFSTVLGLRVDQYDVTAADPIAPAGQIAAKDSHSDLLTSAMLSVNYKLQPDLVWYISGNYNEATSNSMAGGTVLGGDNQINPLNFATKNTLVETGIKYDPADSHWYADAAIFNQRRSLRNRDGSNSGIRTSGIEAQLYYTADRYWLSLAYSYLDARYDNSASFQDSRQVADAFDNSRPDIIEGTGVGAPNFTVFAPSSSRVQGQPSNIVSLNLGYQFTELWQLGVSGVYTKSYPLDFLATVLIRDQYHLNLNTSYQLSPQLLLRLDVFNLTDQQNWRPVFEGGYFGSTLVFPEQPRHVKLTASYRF
jgi:outer membrane receptor protein involved in Fe transport